MDGYNIINARRADGAAMTSLSLADARERLISDLMDYAGWSDQRVVVVFDAWMSDRERRTEEARGPVTVVYTRKGEIADHYIERLCDELAEDVELRRAEVRVASSDALEQTIVLGRGAARMSARELMQEMARLRQTGVGGARAPAALRSVIGDHLPPHVRARLEEMRKGNGK